MNKICLMIVLLAANCTFSIAQSKYPMSLQKGTISAGGGVSFSFGKLESSSSSPYGSGSSKYSYSKISFEPRVSYFVTDGLAIGLITDYTSIGMKPENGEKSTETQYAIGPMVRFYLPGGFFIHSDYSFGKYNSRYGSDNNDQSGLTKYTLGVGYAAFISEKIAIEPSVTYRNTTIKDQEGEFSGKSSLGEFVIGVSINFFLNWKANQ